ncbi:MAG: hypothetical protein ACYC4I_00335 [Minisyncoccota bacterium]
MDTKQLFEKTLKDLIEKSQSNDWYDMLLISGLIYKLLYDEHPLVDEVNITKQKVVFDVNDRDIPNDQSLVFYSIEDGFDPETSVPHLTNIISVDKNALYARKVMVINGEIITVKELIRFLRNKQGGVHSDNMSLTDKDKVLKELQTSFSVGGVNAGFRLMRAISRVVVKGLSPLK